MTFGEKLFKLRKEKGFSQENLAEKLNTTRQAISKWENGQGFPETEKLLMIGNIFEVSIDYLLKETAQSKEENDDGYYVSKEMAEGFLLNQRKVSKYIAFGLFVMALGFIPYFFFNQNPSMYALPTIIIVTIGIGITVSARYLEEDQYKILKQEPLLFDENYLKELKVRYGMIKRRNALVMSVGACVFIAGLIPIFFERKGYTSGFFTPYYPISIAFIAIGIAILSRTSTVLNGYKLLASNEERANSIVFKLRKMLRKKLDGM